jgi:SPP1 gp7 family putative phage head morphogenesis protein
VARDELKADELARALLGLYEAAERKISTMLAAAIARGARGTARFLELQRLSVRAELDRLAQASTPLERPLASSSYSAGVVAVDRSLDLSKAFSGVHTPAVEALANALSTRLADSRQQVGRKVEDVFRRVGLEQTGVAIAAGLTPEQAAREIREELMREGLTSFVDKGGRRWSLADYSAMVARTTTREAVTQGTVNRLADHGRKLVTISTHRSSCPICKPHEGKSYPLDHDPLPPFHPNCRHVAAPARIDFERFEAELDEALGIPLPAGASGRDQMIRATVGIPDPKPDQPFHEFDPLYRQAQEQEEAYRRLLDLGEGLSTQLGARELVSDDLDDFERRAREVGDDETVVAFPPLKDRQKAEDKLRRKRYPGAERLTDLNRGTVLVPNLDQLPDAFRRMRDWSESNGWTLHHFQDKGLFTGDPEEGGYRDISVLVRSPDGHLCELQFTVSPLWEAKFSRGHEIYEETRELDRLKTTRALTPEEETRREALMEESRALYGAAYNRSIRR